MISFFIKELFWPGAFDRFDQFKFLPRPASRSEDSRGSRQLLDWSSLTQFGERNSDKFPCILQSLLKMSEALSKEKKIYCSTLQNIPLISKKFPSSSKARIYFANSSRLSFPFDGQDIPESLSSFNHRNRRTSYFILCLNPNVHRHSFFSILNLHIFKATDISIFSPRLTYSKIRSHREAPASSFKSHHLRASPYRTADPSYYDLQDRRSLPCQQSIENHCPSPI